VDKAAARQASTLPHNRSLEGDARSPAAFDPYIGTLTLQQVPFGSLQTCFRDKLKAEKSPGTVIRGLAVVRRILKLGARLWRDEEDWPWSDTGPSIQMQRHPDKRTPYPRLMQEQRLLFSELTVHLAMMALFKLNIGTREHEVCGLQWSLEVRVPELDTTVLIIPRDHLKSGLERFVVLNRIAKSVIEGWRGEHKEFVFTTQERNGSRHPQFRMTNSGCKAARRRASDQVAGPSRARSGVGRKGINMGIILIIVVLALLFGGGGCCGCRRYGGSGLGGVLGLAPLILLVLWFFGRLHT
jgi:hypothetical protein